MEIAVVVLVGGGAGFTAGLATGLGLRRRQLSRAREARIWAGWRAICAQAAVNRLGGPRRLP